MTLDAGPEPVPLDSKDIAMQDVVHPDPGHAEQNVDRTAVVIEVWLNDYPVVPLFLDETRALAERFTARHPEYRVVVHGRDHLVLPRMVAEAARRGRPPAIVQNFYTSTQLARDMLARDGSPLFTSVEAAIGGRTEILGERVVLDDLVAAGRDYYTDGGELFAVPPLTSTMLLYTNTTLLRRAGIPAAPATWREVEAACTAVEALPSNAARGVSWPNHGWVFQQALAQQGALLADHDNGRSGRAERIDLTSPAMTAFVRWWLTMHRHGHYHYTGVRAAGEDTLRAWVENHRAFAEQRVAMVLSTSVEAQRMVEAGRAGGFDVEVSRMPHNDEVPYAGNVIGGDSLWLTAGLDRETRDGALAFLLYMLDPENVAARHRSSGFIPVTGAGHERLRHEGWFDANPHHRVAVDQLAAGDGSPAALGALLGDFVGAQDVMTDAMHDVLALGADPVARFRSAERAAQRLLDDYHARLAAGPDIDPRHFRVG
ncbi:sn-glycerol 3-phosphate transport system substrate-binding protein [Actinoalloteichus hoggarensis]|nr:extracellular solute-binding protein [Actinoalloteichus hoggarensis]MBB5920852.1 sn-glycerol 3-phosphate transport system substrate-binding protein [Actinoalloteichus hoggarensis]